MRTIAVKVKQRLGGRKVTSISANMTTIVDTYRRRIALKFANYASGKQRLGS